jgi:hypothetical protein
MGSLIFEIFYYELTVGYVPMLNNNHPLVLKTQEDDE